MGEADSDSAALAARFAELLAKQAEAIVELIRLIPAESGDAQAGDDAAGDSEAWVRTAERLEALWQHFVQDQTEAFVAAWPDIVRKATSLLPLVSRGQPLFAMLAQLLPLLVGPEVLGRAIESKGESLVKGLEHLLTESGSGQITHADPPARPVGRKHLRDPGLDRSLP